MTGPLVVPRIIWGALVASTLIYIAVLELGVVVVEPQWEPLLLPLSLAAFGTAAASLLVPRLAMRRRQASSPGDATGAYLATLIIALALAESVAIFGLVLGLLGAPPKFVMPFFVVAWILMFIRFPTTEQLDEFRS